MARRPIRQRLLLGDLPLLRARDVRRKLLGRDETAARVEVELPDGKTQTIELETHRVRFGLRAVLRCTCGRRALALHLDPCTGLWRCWRCLEMRSPRTWYVRTALFQAVVWPLARLERERQLAYRPRTRYETRRRFDALEREVLGKVMADLPGALPGARRPAKKAQEAPAGAVGRLDAEEVP